MSNPQPEPPKRGRPSNAELAARSAEQAKAQVLNGPPGLDKTGFVSHSNYGPPPEAPFGDPPQRGPAGCLDSAGWLGANRNADVAQHMPVGTLEDFLNGFAETCPQGAVVNEYFGVEGDPGAYYSYQDWYGHWAYFHSGTRMTVEQLGRNKGALITEALGEKIRTERNRGGDIRRWLERS